MNYPHGNGSKEDFYNRYYIASGFNERRSSTYLHEGIDINDKRGGDSDLGDAIRAIKDYRLVYYHVSKHAKQNAYGVHFVYEINTPWGLRFIHHEHVQADLPILNKPTGKEGDIIAYTGKTGSTVAHDHMAIYKVDPVAIGGIDVVVGDEKTLKDWWEEPKSFLDKLYEADKGGQVDPLQSCLKDREKFWKENIDLNKQIETNKKNYEAELKKRDEQYRSLEESANKFLIDLEQALVSVSKKEDSTEDRKKAIMAAIDDLRHPVITPEKIDTPIENVEPVTEHETTQVIEITDNLAVKNGCCQHCLINLFKKFFERK